jgi:uncharacterized protein (DUF2147 family)
MKHILPALLAAMMLAALCGGSALAASDISGLWATFDDQGKPSGFIRIARRGAEYFGVIERGLPADNPNEICEACRGDLHGKKIIGLEILSGLHESDAASYLGRIVDPFNGKDYRVRLTPSADGERLKVRGFIGLEVFGRTQGWVRDHGQAQ